MEKQLKAADRTKLRIIDAFWQLFEKKNINKITTTEITSLAGIHRNTFYRYFDSVYDLLDYVEYDLINQWLPYMDEKLVNEEEFINTIVGNIIIANDRHYSLIIKRDAAGYFEKYKRTLIPILQKNFSNQSKYPLDDEQITFLLSGCSGLIVKYFSDKEHHSSDKLIAKLTYFFNLVCNEKS